MAAIGDGWEENAWVEASWVTGAWLVGVVAALAGLFPRIRRRRRR